MTEKEFKVFFDDHFDSIRNYLYYRSGDMELSTDLAQDTFLNIWEKNTIYEGKRTIGFAYKIASDLFISGFRKAKVESKYISSLSFEFDGTNPEQEMEYKELKVKYETTLAKLEDKDRVVFLMSRLEGLKNREIAERLDISIKTVEKRMSSALGTFRTVIKVLEFFLILSLSAQVYQLILDFVKTL